MSQDEARRSAIAKAGRRLLPFLCLCYAVNFLDRVNVGFAALAMNDDLGFSAVGVRRRRRHLLRRLYPVRDAEQSGDAEIRRAHLDRAHHDQLGPRRHRHGLCQRRDAASMSLRFLLGVAEAGLLPGHHPLSHLLVSGAGAGAHRLAVHGGGAAGHHGRRPGLGRAARDARAWRPQGLALAVHRRGPAGGRPRRDRAQISRRPARARALAQPGGADGARRHARGGGQGHARNRLCRARPGADAAARARARASFISAS